MKIASKLFLTTLLCPVICYNTGTITSKTSNKHTNQYAVHDLALNLFKEFKKLDLDYQVSLLLIEDGVKIKNQAYLDAFDRVKREQDAISNSKYPFQTLYNLCPKECKFAALATLIGAPIGEELLFRGLMQDLLCKRFMGRFICTASRGSMAARILFTSTLFAASHSAGNLSPGYQELQVRHNFITGIAWGLIKESKLGLAGAIGCHAINNALAVHCLWQFSPKKL